MSGGRTYADDLFPQEMMHRGEEQEHSLSSPPAQIISHKIIEEANSRIHIGWMTTSFEVNDQLDRSVASYATKLGECKYNFVCYPIGGVTRGFWKPVDDGEKHPPVIDLPDVQLGNNLWENYFTGKISPWIDCDSSDPSFAALSEEHLLKELNYLCYMGLQSMTIELTRLSSPKTAAILNKWIWTRNTRFYIWIQLPPSVDSCKDYNKMSSEYVDIWTIWADFRKQCNNFSGTYLQLALTVCPDLPDEFTEKKLMERWKAEPLAAFIVDSAVFMQDRNGTAMLPDAHSTFLKHLWSSDSLRIIVHASSDHFKYNTTLKSEYSLALRQAVRDVHHKRRLGNSTDSTASISDYKDVLQAPLQPLAENLDSGVYNVFEQDKLKYDGYGDAVLGALKDLCADGRKEVIVYLLGGGRGPIGTKILRAEKEYNTTIRQQPESALKLKLYIVEKNPNAIVTLKFMNARSWKRRVTIIESDMRSLPEVARSRGFEKPDIIVSELLGSFGDNELSPECLDGVTPFLKPDTISIPQKYTSYVAPIMSTYLHQMIRQQSIPYTSRALPAHGRLEPELDEQGHWIQRYPQGHVNYHMDQMYVVFLSKYLSLADKTKPVFTFEHPNFAMATNERSTSVEFLIDCAVDIMGFAGYFDLQLYKNVWLSIEPETATTGMVSWFPVVIPFRDMLRANEGDKIALNIVRKVEATGVWYEWHGMLKKPNGEIITTPVQNLNGESYYMRM